MQAQSAFTPLRIALMILIVIVNIMAVVAFSFPDATWSRLLGIFATVFILLFVFVQILEFVWLLSFKKKQTDPATIKSYQNAINIYLFLFPVGFIMVFMVLI
ncbi:hypothetical protein MNBD_GAMMA01-1631 [hydrothermal vent metagenome]|uniref:Uncharacterized protein n=1 Tax=hydrothermal vent metagenome TaxID=652676 RepID=A0A3B0V4E8_9ZZZZ